MRAGHVGQVVIVDEIVATDVSNLPVVVAKHLLAPAVHGDEGKVELVLGLEHDLLLGDVEEGGRAEGRADAEEGQRRILALLVLTVEDFDAAANVQTLKKMMKLLCS